MVWEPKIIKGGRSGRSNEDSPDRSGDAKRPSEAFTLGQGGFKKIDKPTGDALWDFLDIDKDRTK